jgi:glycosyltransferase involved in cell wall biosynthesis
LPFTAAPNGQYLAFLGRMSPEKRTDRAVEIVARAGMKLKIADKADGLLARGDRTDGRKA